MHIQGRSNCLGHEIPIGKRGEFSQPDPIFIACDQITRDLQGKPGFTTAPWAGQCQEAVPGQQAFNLGKLLLSANKRAERGG